MIYVGGYHTEAGLIIRQAKEQGMKATMVGGDALVTNEFWQIAGEAGAGTMMTFPPDPRLMKTAADVVKEFKAKKVDPEGYVLYTYAAIQVWADAVKKAGTHGSEKGRRGAEGNRQLAVGPGPGQLRQEGRHNRRRLCVLPLEERHLRPDVGHRIRVCSGRA